MEPETLQFISELADQTSGLRDAFRTSMASWSPELPPATAVYADVGRRMADDFSQLSDETKRQLSSKLEAGMRFRDERRDATATGLIEAAVGRANRLGNWPEIRAFLGPLARAHADAWYG